MVKLFCSVVGVAGDAFPVNIDESESVGDLKEVLKAKQPETITVKEANKLKLFLAKKADGTWLDRAGVAAVTLDKHGHPRGFDQMDPTLWINNDKHFGKNFVPAEGDIHVLVLVPPPDVGSKRLADDEIAKVLKRLKLIEPKTLTEFIPLSVHEDEFRLDSLSMTRQSDDPIVMTPTLHEFWKGFGEFPPDYFVRMEEVFFWKVIKKLLFGKDRVVIVGSPGVGKSCFLMLIAFYLACIQKRKVLIIRRLKEENADNALVYLDGKGSYARLSNLQSRDIFAIRDQITSESVEGEVVDEKEVPIVLVDGFTQEQVQDMNTGYGPFKFLATSCQYDAKHDDSARVVVLPAWRDADLLQYAKLTNWVIETGLRKTKRQNIPLSKLVKEQYFYSGGSMREFCKERELLKMRVAKDCLAVDNQQAIELVYNFGGGQSKSQVDRVRRHYITDCNREVDYYDSRSWFLSVDSGYVLSQLGRKIDTGKQLKVFRYAKSVGAGFHGVAYEQLLHNAVRGAFVKRKPVVLKMREGSEYERIEILVPNVVCSGDDEASCYPCLSTLRRDTYWHPDYPFFPFIDAVTTCEAFSRKREVDDKSQDLSSKSETIVAYIQVTIRSEKKFKEERLRRLNEAMDLNSSLKDMKRVFVVVGPDSYICEMFNLKDAPDPETFRTMVGCFRPEQLEPEVS